MITTKQWRDGDPLHDTTLTPRQTGNKYLINEPWWQKSSNPFISYDQVTVNDFKDYLWSTACNNIKSWTKSNDYKLPKKI